MFPKAVTFLGSDSNSKSARLNDKKLLENFHGIDFLFFFEDGNYREIGLDHKAWPDKMSYTCRSQVKKGDVLRLYWTNKFYNARFITKGDSNFIKVVCTQMDNRLDKANTSTEKANLSFSAETEAAIETISQQSRKRPLSELNLSCIDPSAQRKRPKTSGDQEIEVVRTVKESSSSKAQKNLVQSKLKTISTMSLPNESADEQSDDQCEDANSTIPQVQHGNSPTIFDENNGNSQESGIEEVETEGEEAIDASSDTSILNRVCKAIRSLTKVIDNQRRETRELRFYLENELKAATPAQSSVVSEVSNVEKRQIFLKGEDMSLVEGKTAKKYGRNLARKYFTVEELKDRRTNPRKSTSLASLDGEKLQEIKELIEGRFPGEFMQACDAIDDLGRDIKKDIRKSKKAADGNDCSSRQEAE